MLHPAHMTNTKGIDYIPTYIVELSSFSTLMFLFVLTEIIELCKMTSSATMLRTGPARCILKVI